jgi:hypothetical protein
MKELPNPYRYEKGVRVYLSGEEPIPESSYEFINRMKSAEDVSWLDLNRAEDELPVFDECKKDRRCIRSALEGIAVGGKMLVVTAKAGFDNWSVFESLALRKCKAVKKLYQLAKEERSSRRLHGAEEALYERAVEGVDEPMVNHLGQIVGYKKKYSDRLLEVQLKALDPDKYSDKKDKTDKGLVINVEMGLRKKELDKADFVQVNDVQFTGLASSLRENNSENKLDSASE